MASGILGCSSRSSVPPKQPNGAKWTYLGYLYRARWAVVVLSFVILTILGIYALGAFHTFSDGGFHNPHGDATRSAITLVRNFVFPDPDVAVLLQSTAHKVEDPEFQAVAKEVKVAFAKLPTFGYISWFDFPALTSLISDDKHKALMYFKVKERMSNARLTSAVPSPLPAGNFTVTVGGHIVTLNSLTDQVLQDLARAEISSLPVLLILMLFTFGGVVAMLCPLLVALHTITWSFAILRGLASEWHISNYAIEVVTMMGLGLSIDYSLFIVSRFMTERRLRPNPEDILVVMDRVMSTSGRTIQFSAITVMLSLTGAFVFSEYFVGSLALAIMSVAASACVVCTVVLPALLFILDRNIFRLSTAWLCDVIFGYCCKSSRNAEETTLSKEHGYWYRIAHYTMNRPLPILLTAVSAFVALSTVFFQQVKFGYTDANTLPVMSPARVVNHAENTYFSKLGTAQLDVFVQTVEKQGVRSPGFIRELDAFATKASALSGVRDMVCQVRRIGDASFTVDDYIKLYENPMASPAHLAVTSKLYEPLWITDLDRVSRIQLQLMDGAYTPRTRRTVKELRLLLASSFPSTPLSERGITSTPAFFSDLMDDITTSIPVWACVMVAVVFVLVLLMTASPFLAVKAVVTGVLSLGGAFGIILILFQLGEGKSNILNMVPCGYLDGLQLVFIFTVAFGLGVDYELFVLSSIQEWYHRLGDHREAIAEGLNRAGRTVSQAALLLAVVTGSFVLSNVGLIKMIGFGIAISVLLDATVVRSCVVPTVLILAGEKIVWWSPAWLRALRDRLGLTERVLDDTDLLDMEDRTGGTSTPLEAVIVTEAESKDPSRA